MHAELITDELNDCIKYASVAGKHKDVRRILYKIASDEYQHAELILHTSGESGEQFAELFAKAREALRAI